MKIDPRFVLVVNVLAVCVMAVDLIGALAGPAMRIVFVILLVINSACLPHSIRDVRANRQ